MFEFIEHVVVRECCDCNRCGPEGCVGCIADEATCLLETLKEPTDIPGHHSNGDDVLEH